MQSEAINRKSLVVASHNRPPGSSHDQFVQLSAFLQALENDIIQGGGFILPGIDLSCDDPVAPVTGRACSAFLDVVLDSGFEQHIHDAWGEGGTGHVLDLLFCNVPNIISNVNLLPGLSDHRVLAADINDQYAMVPKKQSAKNV